MKNKVSNELTNMKSSQNNSSHFRRLTIAGILLFSLFTGLFIIFSFIDKKINTDKYPTFASQDQLFNTKYVNDIHLLFTDSAWKTMQPYGGPYGKNGTGVGWINIGNVMLPAFIEDGDKNWDGNLTRDEFLELGEYWFTNWDTLGNGQLDLNMLENGFRNSYERFVLRSPEGTGVARGFGVFTPLVNASLQIGPHEFKNITIRYKGNGTLLDTQGQLKKSLKIDLNDGYHGRKMVGLSKLNLHSLVVDPAYMNDAIAYQLFRDAGLPAPRTGFAQIYVSNADSLQNQYLGLYLIVENVDNNFATYWYGTKKGVILKPVSMRLFNYLGDKWGKRYIEAFDPKTPLSSVEEQRLIAVCKFVSKASDEEFSKNLDAYFDLDNLAKYIALNTIIFDMDGLLGSAVQNIYLYLHPKTLKLSFIPWDHDHSLGRPWQPFSQELIEQASIHKPWTGGNFFLERVFKVEKFKKLYLKYLEEFNDTLFQPNKIIQEINEMAATIRPAIEKESTEKLKEFDFAVGWNNMALNPKDSAEDVYPKPLRAYVSARHQSIKDQVNGKSSGLNFDQNIRGGAPGIFGTLFLNMTDINKDSIVTRKEFIHSFDSLYIKWNRSKTGLLTDQEFIDGYNIDVSVTGPDPLQQTDSIKSN